MIKTKWIIYVLLTGIFAVPVCAGEVENNPAYKAATALKNGDYNSAAREFLKRIAADPENPYYYFGIGTAYFEMKQYHKAIRPYEEAIAHGLKNPEVLLNLSSAYYYYGNPDKAIEYLDRYREGPGKDDQNLKKSRDDLDYARQQYGLGIGYKNEGQPMRMQTKMQRALRRYPYYRKALEAIGQAPRTPEIVEINIPKTPETRHQAEDKSSATSSWKDNYIDALEGIIEGKAGSLNRAYHNLEAVLQASPPAEIRGKAVAYQKRILDLMTER